MNKLDIDNRGNIAFFAAQLRKSPMFQLSLSSKELFHSNFLYWISQVSREMFKDLINKLYENAAKKSPVETWPDNFMVSREHKHFDLCVTDKKNNVLMVIENKVKSIPYKIQLDNYRTKSPNADHLLLSLVGKNFPEYNNEIGKEWTIASYNIIANALLNIANEKFGYVYDIIRDYASYIKILDGFAEEWKITVENVTSPYQFNREDYKKLRISDIYQKFLFSQILGLIMKGLREKNVTGTSRIEFNWKHVFHDDNLSKFGADTLYVNSGLTNSTGFFEVKVKFESEIAILIQVQGDQYRRCIEFNNKGKNWPSLGYNINWLCEKAPYQIKQFFAFEEGKKPKIHYPVSIGTESPFIKYKRNDQEGLKTQNGFCKYGNCFIYQYLKIDNKLIDDIVNAVVDDMMNFRSIVGTNIAD